MERRRKEHARKALVKLLKAALVPLAHALHEKDFQFRVWSYFVHR
jgi:hypothetical protein